MVSIILTGQGMTGQFVIPPIVGSLDPEKTAEAIAEYSNETVAGDLIRRIEEDGPENVSYDTTVHRSQMTISFYVGYLVPFDTGLIDEANTPRTPVEALGSCLQQIIGHGR